MCSHDPIFGTNKNRILKNGSCERVLRFLLFFVAVLQFEVSGKWPDDLDAIKHIKTAFHIKLAEELQEQCHLIALPTPTHVDILKVSHYIYILRNVCLISNTVKS